MLQTAAAVAISFAICKTASYVTNLCKIQGGIIPGVTAIVVVLATLFPSQFNHLAPSGEKLAIVLMQVSKISDPKNENVIHIIHFMFCNRCFSLWLVRVGVCGM